MKVVATQQGHYDQVLRNRGDVFVIKNDGDFAPQWMRPAKGETEKPLPKKKPLTKDELEKKELDRSAFGIEGKDKTEEPAKEPEREELDEPEHPEREELDEEEGDEFEEEEESSQANSTLTAPTQPGENTQDFVGKQPTKDAPAANQGSSGDVTGKVTEGDVARTQSLPGGQPAKPAATRRGGGRGKGTGSETVI